MLSLEQLYGVQPPYELCLNKAHQQELYRNYSSRRIIAAQTARSVTCDGLSSY